MNRIFQVVIALVLAGVAVTEQPRAVFNALHEMGEGCEVAEQVRARVGFFAMALVVARRAALVLGSSFVLGSSRGSSVLQTATVHVSLYEAAVNHVAAWLSGHHQKYLTKIERKDFGVHAV